VTPEPCKLAEQQKWKYYFDENPFQKKECLFDIVDLINMNQQMAFTNSAAGE
jgi:hypothetical protein